MENDFTMIPIILSGNCRPSLIAPSSCLSVFPINTLKYVGNYKIEGAMVMNFITYMYHVDIESRYSRPHQPPTP